MSVRFVLGRAGVGKSYTIFEEIKQELALNHGKRLILLVPEQYTLQAERDLLKSLDVPGIMGIEVLSISRLGHRILNETGGSSRTFINQQGKHMLLKRIINEHGGHLTIYSRACRQQGFITRLADLITELKQQDITPEELLAKGSREEDSSNLEQKLHDIGLLYQFFHNYLQDNYIDMEDYINLVIRKMRDSTLLAGALVWVDSFTTFSSQSLRVMEEIMSLAETTTVSLTLDPNPEVRDNQVFALSWHTYRKIREIAEKRGLEHHSIKLPAAVSREKQLALCFLERELYSYPFNCYEHDCPEIQLFAARSINTEVEHLAAKVVELIRERGYRYRDIAVVCNNMETYGRLIKRVFDKYAIPVFMDEKREIMGNPIIELILSVLELARGRYRYEEMFRYLKTGLAGLSPDQCDILENYVLAHGIKARDWKQGFNRGENQDLPELERMRSIVMRPLQILEEDLRGRKTARESSQALIKFFTGINLAAQIEQWTAQLGENLYYEMQSECRQIWNIVMVMLEQITGLLGDQIMGPRELGQILETGLKSLEMGIIPTTVDQVLAGSIQRSKSHDIKALFVIGVNDGVLPTGNWPEGIFTEEEKSSLRNQGLEIGLSRDLKTAEEDYLIYSALTKPTRLLRLSYAWSDLESRALRPSLLIARFKQILPQLQSSHDLLENRDIDRELISTPGSTYKYLVENLRNELDGRPVDDIWWAVHCWYRDHPCWQDKIQSMIAGFFHDNQPVPLGEKKARQIYDWPLKASASRMEQYISCPFAHYMRYGLRPKKRAFFQIEAPDIGEILHRILQGFSRQLSREKLAWRDVDRSICNEISDKVSEQLLADYQQGIFASSSRYRYMSQRLKRISRRAAWTLTTQLQKGEFSFGGHELRFGCDDYCDFPALEVELPGGEIIYLEGRIDRVDLLDEENEIYVKIIDYKSSERSLKLADLYYGLNLQLIIYLAAVLKGLQAREGKPAHPAGMFYFRLDDPLVDGGAEMDLFAIESAINKQLKMTGIAVADIRIVSKMDGDFSGASDVLPVRIKQNGEFYSDSSVLEEEWFQRLVDYALKQVGTAAEMMLKGWVKIEPVKKGVHVACLYCEYKSVCQFDQLLDSNNYRNLASCSDEVVLNRLQMQSKGGEPVV